MRQRHVVVVLCVFALALSGCTGATEDPELADETDEAVEEGAGTAEDDAAEDDAAEDEAAEDEEGGDGEDAAGSSWTFLVYLIGDTDLEPFALEDLTEMAAVGSQENVDVVALVDRAAGHSSDGVLDEGDWESAKLFHVLPGELEEVADLGEINMGEAGTLSQFVAEATALFPADRYALSIWDHGGGWTGMGPDDSAEDVLDLPELVEGLGAGLGEAGVERLELLGFDACLMATYEVASALTPFTSYFVASQELEPGHGWDYQFLQVLADDPRADGARLGSEIIATFDAQAQDRGTANDITLSLVDTSFMPALDEAMGVFADQLAEQAAVIAPVVGRQRAETLAFGRSENPEQDSQLADLGVFVAELGVQSLQVADAADAVQRAIGDAVIERTAGPARLGATGLSIYFPPTGDLFDPSYPAEAFQPVAAWTQFLGAYHNAGSAIPEEEQAAFSDPDAPLEVFEADGGVEVEAPFEPASLENLVDAFITYGVTDPETGEIILLGDDDAEVTEEGTVVGFSDLTTFSISDGEDTMLAYLGLTTDPESGLSTATIPFDYETADGTATEVVELSIVLDEEGSIIEETFFVVDESGTWGEFTPEPEGLLVPVVPVVAEDGSEEWVAFGEGLFTDVESWEYVVEPIEEGTEVYVELSVEDFGGNVATVAGAFDA